MPHQWFTGDTPTFITQLQFAAYRLQVRDGASNVLLRARRLAQEYWVDQYAKVESSRLGFIRRNQPRLRTKLYQGVVDAHSADDVALAGEGAVTSGYTAANVGKRLIILPATFAGGPRYMHKMYQNSMAIVRHYSKPDLFITMTCNPKWEEIKRELLPGQQPADRPDLASRVFKLKLDALMQDLTKHSCLGRVVAHIHVVEFQKRGLPHAHILLILSPDDKLRSPEDYDKVVCAELPDPDTEKELFDVVSTCMMHGPCGERYPNAPCMVHGSCSKHYPREYCDETYESADAYPVYRRRNDGRKVTVRHAVLDNRYVVPYNRALALRYRCHINVEVCATVRSVKYLHKYVYKGPDRAAVQLQAPAAAAPEAAPQPGRQ